MKIKLKINRVVAQNAGEIVDVTPDEAARLIAAGRAEAVCETKVETAALEPHRTVKRKRVNRND
jgi:hypothetical protein